jgi:hypothetical protein
MRPVIVTGMGRSGTSVVAGVLHTLGLPMGEKFYEGKKEGYHTWEDTTFRGFNRAYAIGNMTELQLSVVIEVLGGMRSKKYERWGFKDPHVIYCHEIYTRVLNPIYVLCERDRKDIVSGFTRLYPFKGPEILSTIQRREKMIETLKPDVVVHYETFRKDTDNEIARLCKELELSPTKKRKKKARTMVH